MRLSEAIRLGAMVSPQVLRGGFVTADGACALGAALLAIGARPEEAMSSLFERWPWTVTVSWNCPSCGGSAVAPLVIIHLNDHHRWNRDKIARWVATLEPESGRDAPEAGQLGEPLEHVSDERSDRLVLMTDEGPLLLWADDVIEQSGSSP